ncbi:MAG: alkaline phosphatase [Fusobacteriaceae bacterium]|jgi:alkaline phosphatase|nr:phoA [Fusobacteriales bacterium]MDN5303335.1 alkaline phosphatase [Fusobacteriaceae bacterium]
MKKVILVLMLVFTTIIFAAKPKYVFLFIGDGMAAPQVMSTSIYLENTSNEKLAFTDFKAQGFVTTYSANSFITDSAAAGTAIATGNKTDSGVISMDSTKTKKYTSIAKYAKEELNMKVGIVSSVSLDHATPAVFYATEPSRNNYYNIAKQIATSNFDYFAGGGIKGNTASKRKNNPDLIPIFEKAGYKVINNKYDFNRLKEKNNKIIAINPVLTGGEAMPYEIDRKNDKYNNISLAEFTKKGIELLDNENGFFMMVEGGKIDWAGHANDAASVINDTLAFNDAVKEAVNFYNEHPNETLIIVTGDHETGGMSIGFAGTKYSTFFDKIKNQTVSYEAFNNEFNKYKETYKNNAKFDDVMPMLKKYFGLGEEDLTLTSLEIQRLKNAFNASINGSKNKDEDYLLYGGYEPLVVTATHILNNKAGIGWTSYSHTGVPVPLYAKGNGEEIFKGFYDNTDIYKKLKYVLSLGI